MRDYFVFWKIIMPMFDDPMLPRKQQDNIEKNICVENDKLTYCKKNKQKKK